MMRHLKPSPPLTLISSLSLNLNLQSTRLYCVGVCIRDGKSRLNSLAVSLITNQPPFGFRGGGGLRYRFLPQFSPTDATDAFHFRFSFSPLVVLSWTNPPYAISIYLISNIMMIILPVIVIIESIASSQSDYCLSTLFDLFCSPIFPHFFTGHLRPPFFDGYHSITLSTVLDW